LREVQPGQELTNAERVVYEFNDLIALIEVLYDKALIPYEYDRKMIAAKKEKIKKFLQYSKECGTLTE
jgi:hypothetical protein